MTIHLSSASIPDISWWHLQSEWNSGNHLRREKVKYFPRPFHPRIWISTHGSRWVSEIWLDFWLFDMKRKGKRLLKSSVHRKTTYVTHECTLLWNVMWKGNIKKGQPPEPLKCERRSIFKEIHNNTHNIESNESNINYF